MLVFSNHHEAGVASGGGIMQMYSADALDLST